MFLTGAYININIDRLIFANSLFKHTDRDVLIFCYISGEQMSDSLKAEALWFNVQVYFHACKLRV